jgi:hypothetical protein
MKGLIVATSLALACAVSILGGLPPAVAQGDLKSFCNTQNALCTGEGCSANPGPQGVKHCRDVVCGGRLARCLETGCYQWGTRPAVCFGKEQIRACENVSSCEQAAERCRQTQKQGGKQLNCERSLADCRRTGIWSGTYARCRIAK